MVETERNMRGEHLVVQSLEVLEDFTGGAARAIDAKIGSVQETVVNVASRADKFYQDAAADGIITPEEKKTLKRDFGELRRVYLAILQQAEIKGLSDDPRITGLTTVYSALYTYLYSTIKVFDDMQANTVITSSDDMNAYYDAYYDAEMFAQAVLTQTALAYVRVLSSLDDPGLSNELGYYKGQLYRYVVNEGWLAVSSGDYMGVVSSASALAEKGDVPDGSFFLCGSSFIVAEYRLTTSEGVMTTDGGNHFALTVRADAGDVWALEGGVWRRVPDRNDWRYILATNDLVALGFPISPSLEGEIRSVAKDAALELSPGKYLGPRTADPVSPALGEYYLYIGNTTLTRKNGALYKYMRTSGGTAAWTELSSEDPANYQNYMAALSDMLAEDEQSLDTGRFSVVFARSLAAMSAMIETLMAQTMILKSGGVFKSEDFDSGTGAGFRLSADGVLEAREGVFSGTINAAGGSFTGDLVGGKVYFSALGLYGLQAGNVDNGVSYSPSAGSQPSPGVETIKKGKLTIDAANSSLRLAISIIGRGGGDTYARPTVNLGIYYKKNGNVSESNYDQKETYSGSPGTSGTQKTLSANWDFNINNPGEYIEVLFTYSTNGIWIPPSMNASIKISQQNRYLKSCVDIIDL